MADRAARCSCSPTRTPRSAYELAVETRPDAIVATGRSDYPNQVNNSMGFPYIFRGALDVRARQINQAMKLAAARALAELAREDVPDMVLSAYGLESLSSARSTSSRSSSIRARWGGWRRPWPRRRWTPAWHASHVDLDEYRESLEGRFGRGFQIMNRLMQRARSAPKRRRLRRGRGAEDPARRRPDRRRGHRRADPARPAGGHQGARGQPGTAQRAAHRRPDPVGPGRAVRRSRSSSSASRKGMTIQRAMGRLSHAELLRRDDGRAGRGRRLPLRPDLRLRLGDPAGAGGRRRPRGRATGLRRLHPAGAGDLRAAASRPGRTS